MCDSNLLALYGHRSVESLDFKSLKEIKDVLVLVEVIVD